MKEELGRDKAFQIRENSLEDIRNDETLERSNVMNTECEGQNKICHLTLSECESDFDDDTEMQLESGENAADLSDSTRVEVNAMKEDYKKIFVNIFNLLEKAKEYKR